MTDPAASPGSTQDVEGEVNLHRAEKLGVRFGLVFRRATALARYTLAQKRCTHDHAGQDRQTEGKLAHPAIGIRSKPKSQHGAHAALQSGDDAGNIRSNGRG
jgi:hypothetical protein